MSEYAKPDHWTKKAKAQGYAARSVFKLQEIDQRMRLLPKGGRVVDLGCYPGSWSRYLLERGCAVVGVDFRAPELPDGTYLVGSVMDVTGDQLREALGGAADGLVSDMAPATSGNRFTDHCRQIELARVALRLAGEVVRPGGCFVVKVFEGEDAPVFVKEVEAQFSEVRRFKPEATRDRSVEFFVAARGRRG